MIGYYNDKKFIKESKYSLIVCPQDIFNEQWSQDSFWNLHVDDAGFAGVDTGTSNTSIGGWDDGIDGIRAV